MNKVLNTRSRFRSEVVDHVIRNKKVFNVSYFFDSFSLFFLLTDIMFFTISSRLEYYLQKQNIEVKVIMEYLIDV